jgi:hypothetical protein
MADDKAAEFLGSTTCQRETGVSPSRIYLAALTGRVRHEIRAGTNPRFALADVKKLAAEMAPGARGRKPRA